CSGDHLELHSFPTRRSSDLLYDERTNAPLSTWRKPKSNPISSYFLNWSGVINSFTGKCFLLGCKYCPIVITSNPTFRRSCIVSITSSSVSPNPHMIPDLVRLAPLAFR